MLLRRFDVCKNSLHPNNANITPMTLWLTEDSEAGHAYCLYHMKTNINNLFSYHHAPTTNIQQFNSASCGNNSVNGNNVNCKLQRTTCIMCVHVQCIQFS